MPALQTGAALPLNGGLVKSNGAVGCQTKDSASMQASHIVAPGFSRGG